MKRTVTQLMVKAALAMGVAGCTVQAIDAEDLAALPSIAGYQSWTRHQVQGFVPGHKASLRWIYINPAVEQTVPGAAFPAGAVIVKEIYQREGTPTQPVPGDLLELAIMRRPAPGTTDLPLDAGWLFTDRSRDGEEKRVALCWSTCHQQSPHAGVFLDYSPR